MNQDSSKTAAPTLRISVGVMGSAGGDLNRQSLDKALRMGKAIARRGCVLITGACPGLPHQAVLGAREEGGTVVGISPALNFEEHAMKYASPYHGYDAIIYTGSGLMGREIENIRSCDMVVFMGGRSGTLGEFAIAYDEAKVIGVLKGTGGITDKIETIISFIQKNTGAQVVYAEEPEDLLEKLMEVYNQRLLPYYKTILANSSPDGDLEP
jgi:uncharacterized protein (TIGR00725 family)